MSPLKVAALFLLGVVLLFPNKLAAQEQLSLQDAIRIGLQNNYDIQIAGRQEAIAENNVTRGNAGFLPNVDARGGRTFSENNSRQQFQTGPDRTRNGASSNNLNGSINLNWTIFDGMGMFINYDRLKALEKSGALFTRETVQNTLANIFDNYFEVVRQSKKMQAIEDAIAISQARVDIAQAQYEVGVSAKVEILRAQVDFNTDRSELLVQQEALQNAKINLNQLLSRDPNIDFVAVDSIVVDPNLNYGNADAGMLANNPLLGRLKLNQEIASLDIRSVRASRLPVIGVVGAYNFNRSENEPLNEFSPLFNQNRGYNYGLSVSLPLFRGFNTNRLAQNARINMESANLEYQRQQNLLDAALARAYSQYTNRLQLLQLEETNLTLAQENAAIALERYRLGLLTAIELREAQRNQLVAENRLIDIQFQAKAAETELKRISSTLLQEGAE
ncbi:TolC family protein [Pontibacter sp. HSC-36F09]|uniref:TolC family protein n=1 Tax=Pontibacter sp. HSC-36F09 TaxID=2910966 RepID=UPI00209F1387|nr:TolC family protein [Pontibacter sp. HSC-36F09]MCP2043591.1 outer membrane protein TolC [Pontibacter sp. HSC-36F09]